MSIRIEDGPHPGQRRRRILSLLLVCSVAGFVLASQDGKATRGDAPLAPSSLAAEEAPEALVESMALAAQQASVDTIPIPEASPWITVEVQRGQTFSTLIEANGMPRPDWLEVLALKGDTERLKRLRVGDKLYLRQGDDGRLEELVFDLDELRTLQIRRIDGKLEAITLTAELERQEQVAFGMIRSSLFAAGAEAGLSDRLIMELAEIFGYDLDFALDLRQGDYFTVVYETLYRNGERLREGRILAAEFVNQGRSLQAFRHEDRDGVGSYYRANGEALRTAFRRNPLDVVRISSHFNLQRRHPILNTIRAHRGVDYAAPTGTPIRATGDGRVEFMGVKGGYGRTVVLKHGRNTETLYAHLSRFRDGLRVGQRVSQGQVIGYVGMTGLATAPHLHYEFRVNGVHKNPMTVPLPRANPLSRSELAQWQPRVQAWIAQMDQVAQKQLAQNRATATEDRQTR